MPYKIIGNKVMHKKGGKWSVKQTCKSHANAVKALGLLQGLESGSIKPSEVGKKRPSKKTSVKQARKKYSKIK